MIAGYAHGNALYYQEGEGSNAGQTGLEPATSGVTDRHSNQLSYYPLDVGNIAPVSLAVNSFLIQW